MVLGDSVIRLVSQPDRLKVPRSTRVRYQVGFAWDGLALAAALGLVVAGMVVGAGWGFLLYLGASILGMAAIIGLALGRHNFRPLNLVERRRVPLLWGRVRDGMVVLMPGPRVKRSRNLNIVPGEAVTVDVAPDRSRVVFGVVVALRWTLTSGGRSTSFRTYFEPDVAFFDEVETALAGIGVRPVFSYQLLSHSFSSADK